MSEENREGEAKGDSLANRPINPEMENVAVNRPQESKAPAIESAPPQKSTVNKNPQEAVSAPKKIGKEINRKKSNTRFILGCFGGLLVLFVLFVLLMVFVMARGGGNNAVIAAFGLAPGAIRSFLLSIINLAFGFLGLLFFVLMAIGFFRFIGAKKGDKEARSAGIKMTLFSLIPFVLVLLIWIFLFSFIGRLEIITERVKAEIVVLEPADLKALQAPVEVRFSAVNVKKALSQNKLAVSSAAWDLDGDGEFETPLSATGEVSRLYRQRGVYTVGLKVQVVGEPEPRVYTMPLQIQDAVFGADPATGTAPLTVQFDAADLVPQGSKVESLDWDFENDGTYELTGADNLRPRFTFEKIGTYKVHLRIINQGSTVDNDYRDIEIVTSDTPLLLSRIEASPSLKGTFPFSVRFDGLKSSSAKGKITRYEWDFGDGSALQEGKSVSHIFEKAGLYVVSLTVTEDSGKTEKTSVNVDVLGDASAPTALISTLPAATEMMLEGTLPFKVALDASGSSDVDNDIVDYEWAFDAFEEAEMVFDENRKPDKTGKKIEHTFEKEGTFRLQLTVRDSEGQEGYAAIRDRVQKPGVVAVIKAVPEEGTVPLMVQFDGSGSSTFDGRIVSYEWNFGDGTPVSITGATITHKYESVGSFTAKLKVTTNTGKTAEITQPIFIREIPLRACFETSRSQGVAPLSVTFDTQCSTGAISTFKWNFGDGTESTSRKPAHTFEKPGTYTVTLEIADDKKNVNVFSAVVVATGEAIQ